MNRSGKPERLVPGKKTPAPKPQGTKIRLAMGLAPKSVKKPGK